MLHTYNGYRPVWQQERLLGRPASRGDWDAQEDVDS